MPIAPYLRPDLDQTADQLPLYITGTLPNAKPGEAYEGRLQIHNQIGACSIVSVTGSDVPPGGSWYVDGDELVLQWPEYKAEDAPILNPGFEGDKEGSVYGGVRIVAQVGPVTAHTLTWEESVFGQLPIPGGVKSGDSIFAMACLHTGLPDGGIPTPPGWTLVDSVSQSDSYTKRSYIFSKDVVSEADSGTEPDWPFNGKGYFSLAYVVARSATGSVVVAGTDSSYQRYLSNPVYGMPSPIPVRVAIPQHTATGAGHLALVVVTNSMPHITENTWTEPDGANKIGPEGTLLPGQWYPWPMLVYEEPVSKGFQNGSRVLYRFNSQGVESPSGGFGDYAAISMLLRPSTPITDHGPGDGMTGWTPGAGWSVTSNNPVDGVRSAVFMNTSGESVISSNSRYPVTGAAFSAHCKVRQGASSAGNAGGCVRVEFRDADGQVVGFKDGKLVMSASNNAVYPSNVSVYPQDYPAGAMTVNIAGLGIRKRQNREVWVDTFSWDYKVASAGINVDAELCFTITIRDSAGRTASWAGCVTIKSGVSFRWVVNPSTGTLLGMDSLADYSSPGWSRPMLGILVHADEEVMVSATNAGYTVSRSLDGYVTYETVGSDYASPQFIQSVRVGGYVYYIHNGTTGGKVPVAGPLTWESFALPANGPEGFAYFGGLFWLSYGLEWGGGKLYSSPDLVTWTLAKTVAGYVSSMPRIAVSEDTLAVAWTQEVGTPDRVLIQYLYGGVWEEIAITPGSYSSQSAIGWSGDQWVIAYGESASSVAVRYAPSIPELLTAPKAVLPSFTNIKQVHCAGPEILISSWASKHARSADGASFIVAAGQVTGAERILF